jgi:hypothetical protein
MRRPDRKNVEEMPVLYGADTRNVLGNGLYQRIKMVLNGFKMKR